MPIGIYTRYKPDKVYTLACINASWGFLNVCSSVGILLQIFGDEKTQNLYYCTAFVCFGILTRKFYANKSNFL